MSHPHSKVSSTQDNTMGGPVVLDTGLSVSGSGV